MCPQPPQSFFELLQISERLLLGSFFWERFRAKTAQGQFHLYNIFPSQGFSDCFYAHGFLPSIYKHIHPGLHPGQQFDSLTPQSFGGPAHIGHFEGSLDAPLCYLLCGRVGFREIGKSSPAALVFSKPICCCSLAGTPDYLLRLRLLPSRHPATKAGKDRRMGQTTWA